MFEEGEDTPKFEIDGGEFRFSFEICWICKNRGHCPMEWECETIANLDNDDSDLGDDEA